MNWVRGVRFDERRLETEPWRGVRHRHRRKPPGTATPSAYRHRASRRLYTNVGATLGGAAGTYRAGRSARCVGWSVGRSSCPRSAALVHESKLPQPFSVLLGTELRSHPHLRRCLEQLVISTRHQDLPSKWCERTNLLYLCSVARLVAELDHCSLVVEVTS